MSRQARRYGVGIHGSIGSAISRDDDGIGEPEGETRGDDGVG